jgi:ankyrin repeat protein
LEYQEDIVDDFNADGENALHVAIRQKNARIAQLLLDVDIDLNALVKPPSMDEGLSPLSLAIKSDSLDIVKMLLKAGMLVFV